MYQLLKHEDAFTKAYATLNERQKEAVDCIEGPVLVVAGPGTGKTQILAVRIGNILTRTDTLPESILCLTYTDAGTVAMRRRLASFIGPAAYRVGIYTFHAFCNEVIQSNPDYFGRRDLEPVSELEQVSIVENILHTLPPNHILKKFTGDFSNETSRLLRLFEMMKKENWLPEIIAHAIDKYLTEIPTRDEFIYKKPNKTKGIAIGDLKTELIKAETEKMEKLRSASALFNEYQQQLQIAGRYDYADMILWVLRAFAKDENLLRNYQERYLYFLVDEFQDTNGAQSEILQQLTSYWDVPNVFAVGDDDQSIYEFQGARVKNILDFYNRYHPHIKLVVLTDNYRSTQSILDASKCVIDNNSERLINKLKGLSKQLQAKDEDRVAHNYMPEVHMYKNVAQEEAGVMHQIEELRQAGVPLNEIAVLYYRHAQADNLIRLCEKQSIPYQVRKKLNILEIPLIQNLLLLLRYIHDEMQKPNSGEHFLFRILHFPYFEIHPYDIASISAYIAGKRDTTAWRTTIADAKELAQIRLKNPENILRFEQHLQYWLTETGNLTLPMLFEKMLNESGLLHYMLKQNDRMWLLEVFNTLFDFVKQEASKKPHITIAEFLELIDQMETHGIGIPVNKTINHQKGVNFISTHSAKGLEFDYVFLIGCMKDKWEKARGNTNNFKLPDTLTFTDEDNKTESLRRLFYVAITRARQHLYISFAEKNNEDKDLEASQFVLELTDGMGIGAMQKNPNIDTLMKYKIAELTEAPPTVVPFFDKTFIQSKIEHFVMSASALNAYLDCPVRFYFERIVKVPQAKSDSMAFGSAVHLALKRLFDKMKENEQNKFPPVEDFIKVFEYEMYNSRDAFTDKQFQNRLDYGKKILPEYYENYVAGWNRIVVTEYPIRGVEIDGIPVTGVFDKIEFNGNAVNVVDYKTGKYLYAKDKLNAPDENNPDGGNYWRQLVFYKLLLDAQKVKPWQMQSGEIDFIEKDKKEDAFIKHKIMVTAEDVITVKHQLIKTYNAIQQLKFAEGCNKEDCIWCNFVRENYHPENFNV